MPVTRSELIDEIAEKLHLAKGRAELIVTAIFDSMVDALKRGDGIENRGVRHVHRTERLPLGFDRDRSEQN
jgi:nucleoid DNA-binding protein